MGAEKEAEETRRVAEQDFENRCSGKEWRVSMSEMPKAITKAEASGKTPLLLDMTSSHAIDTLYSYQMSQVIEGKKLVMQGRTDTGLAGVMEESRALMVPCAWLLKCRRCWNQTFLRKRCLGSPVSLD